MQTAAKPSPTATQSRSLPAPIPTESLHRSLCKTGGTPFSAEIRIDVEMDGGPWFMPGSAVNELRREALDALLKKREVPAPVAAPPRWSLPASAAAHPAAPPHPARPVRELGAGAGAGAERASNLILPIAQADRVPREWRAEDPS